MFFFCLFFFQYHSSIFKKKRVLWLSSIYFYIQLSWSIDLRCEFVKLIRINSIFNIHITYVSCWLMLAHTNFFWFFFNLILSFHVQLIKNHTTLSFCSWINVFFILLWSYIYVSVFHRCSIWFKYYNQKL